jgi:predicted ArsR family transcriptional regulator
VEELKPKALEVLKSAEVPMGVGDVARLLGVSWTTARAILMALEIEGKVRSLKTSKSKVYFVKQEVEGRGDRR